MSEITSKINYIEGLAEGKGLGDDNDNGKVILELIKVVSKLADQVESIENRLKEVEQFKNDLTEELEQTEEFMSKFMGDLGMDDSSEFPSHMFGFNVDDDDDDDYDFEDFKAGFYDDEEDDDDMYEVTCKECGHTYLANFDDFIEDEVVCPKCGSVYTMDEEILDKLLEGDMDDD